MLYFSLTLWYMHDNKQLKGTHVEIVISTLSFYILPLDSRYIQHTWGDIFMNRWEMFFFSARTIFLLYAQNLSSHSHKGSSPSRTRWWIWEKFDNLNPVIKNRSKSHKKERRIKLWWWIFLSAGIIFMTHRVEIY